MKKWVALLCVLAACAQPPALHAQTQNIGGYTQRAFDTSSLYLSPLLVEGVPNITTGPSGTAVVNATAEVVCGTTNNVTSQIMYGPGTFNGLGSNFHGQYGAATINAGTSTYNDTTGLVTINYSTTLGDITGDTVNINATGTFSGPGAASINGPHVITTAGPTGLTYTIPHPGNSISFSGGTVGPGAGIMSVSGFIPGFGSLITAAKYDSSSGKVSFTNDTNLGGFLPGWAFTISGATGTDSVSGADIFKLNGVQAALPGTHAAVTISSGTYDNGTGNVSLTIPSTTNAQFAPGQYLYINASGTAVSGLNGFQLTTGGTNSTTINYTASGGAGLGASISGGSVGPTSIYQSTPALTISAVTGGSVVNAREVLTIASATYDSVTGLVTVNTSTPVTHLVPGDFMTISGATGTGAFASINGSHALSSASLSTSSSQFYFSMPTGLTMTITGGTITSSPGAAVAIGDSLTGSGTVGINPTTVAGDGTTNPGTLTGFGGTGTYLISDNTITGGDQNLFTLKSPPVGALSITPAEQYNACNNGFVIVSLTGVITGAPNKDYWVGVAINSDTILQREAWDNAGYAISTY